MSEVVSIEALTSDPKNANKGTPRGAGMIERSLRDYGAGRSILIDKNNVILCGNKTAESAAAIGLDEVIVVETDGTQLVAVKRTDLDINSEEGQMLALVDNRASEVSLNWDVEVLTQLQQDGLELEKFWFPEELDDLLGDGKMEVKQEEVKGGDWVVTANCATEEEAMALAERLQAEGFFNVKAKEG